MLLVLSILIVFVFSFFCSLSEASILSVSRSRIAALAEDSVAARVVSKMKDTLDRPVVVILILNTLANTGGSAIVGREYERTYGGEHALLFTVLFTLGVLVLSEIVPKTLGVLYALRVSLLVARPLQLVIDLLRPATWLIERGTRFLGGERRTAVSVDDLVAVARLAVGRKEQMIIEAAAELPRILVSQIMIHREDIVVLPLSDDEETLRIKARRSMHSRLVLAHTNLDDVIGIVNVKEVLWRLVTGEAESLKRVLGESIREPLYVEPDVDVSRLLHLFSMRHEHVAVVKLGDHVVGMVTFEDVVEEIVGEVDDEYDQSPEQVDRLGPTVYRFGGGTLWHVVAKTLSIRAEDFLPEDLDLDLDGRYDINDLAADLLRGKLRTGAMFVLGKWRFQVIRMRRGKVLRVEASLMGWRESAKPEAALA